jgi:hypothetical protein
VINYTKFDAELMNLIAHTYKPFGFAYSIHEGAARKAQNEYGHRNQQNDRMTSQSVTEMDSMSKTITAIAMLKLISRVPEVKTAYDVAKPTTPDAPEWSTWTQKVVAYLDHKIEHLLPGRSLSGIDWNTLPAAKTITIKQLLRHTSGLCDCGGDDAVSIERSLQHWTGTTPTTKYANPNYDFFRYIIPVFADRFVTPQPLLAASEAIWRLRGGPQLLEVLIGALYADIVEQEVMSIFSSDSLPSIEPWGQQVEFANQTGTLFWDIMNDVGPWPTLCGSWGWKMSVDQFAKLIAAVESGTIMPKEYWTLMKRSADTNDYGYAMSRVCSDFPRVRAGGAYYSHKGRDGTNSEIAGQGFWLTWGPAAMCYRVNSPFEGSYGMSSGDSDQTLNYLFQAVDTALNASLT